MLQSSMIRAFLERRPNRVLLPIALVLMCVSVIGKPTLGMAEVFYAQDEALKRAFPDATRTITHTVVLSSSQRDRIEKLGQAPLKSTLFTLFEGMRGEESLGFAAIDSEIVRTLPQAFMVVISPEGTVRSTIILAFHEPLDYLPTASWLNQFTDRELSDKLTLSGDISGILGSTLSARAVTRGVRRVMAIHQVLRIDGELQREYEPSSEADALVVASAQKGS